MEAMQALLSSIHDAVSDDPKPDWRQSLLDGLDAVEAERNELRTELIAYARELKSEKLRAVADRAMLLVALEEIIAASTDRWHPEVQAVKWKAKGAIEEAGPDARLATGAYRRLKAATRKLKGGE